MNRRLIIMSVIAALLASYLLIDRYGINRSLPPEESGASKPAGNILVPSAQLRNEPKLNPLEALDSRSFAAILERPLFDPGRQPRVEEPPPPPPVAEEPPVAVENPQPASGDYQLLAIAGGPSGRVAAVRLVGTGEVVYVREGQMIEPWPVIAVNDRSIVIGSAEHNIEIALFEGIGQPQSGEAASGNGEVPETPSD